MVEQSGAVAAVGGRGLFVTTDHALGRAIVTVLALPLGSAAFAGIALGVSEVAELGRRLGGRPGFAGN